MKFSPFFLHFILIDVRDNDEVSTSIIANDSCRPYQMSWNNNVLKDSIAKLPRDTALIIYCRSGNRSGKASNHLDSNGFKKVYNLLGGINGWKGTKKTGSSLRPLSDLPKFSMDPAPVTAATDVAPALRPKHLNKT